MTSAFCFRVYAYYMSVSMLTIYTCVIQYSS